MNVDGLQENVNLLLLSYCYPETAKRQQLKDKTRIG